MRDIKIFADDRFVEYSAKEQINIMLEQPAFADAKIRIMPDVHAGAGCVIGFTADLGDKVIPNIVGVDIGCGMLVAKTTQKIDLPSFDSIVHQSVPSGFSLNKFKYKEPELIISMLRCKGYLNKIDRLLYSLGTLGGGNHFVELDSGDDGDIYLVIHTGSRNLGLQVAMCYQKLAEEKCEDDVPKDLKYLTGKDRDDYLHDMKLCQRFARINRSKILSQINQKIGEPIFSFEFESVHNYIDDNNMVRKGAISAHKGEKLIIPMNMRDGCIIGVGKGNEDWNESAPHGAGRILSRKEAREKLDLDEFRGAMQGVYSTTLTEKTIDEAPMAYKPKEVILSQVGDTVDIEKIIKPIYNYKGE